jgi:8-oxo-dGTP pyrophosphatase MutT (NUDIX family)
LYPRSSILRVSATPDCRSVNLPWPALASAQRCNPQARVPFFADHHAVGSVHVKHLAVLAAWPQWLRVVPGLSVTLLVGAGPERDRALATVNQRLRELGLVLGWRDETIALVHPEHGQHLGRIERASARFWGSLTLGAHANGYLADTAGRPTHLWLARRSANKATDPGLWDNLVGGGVPDGQTPWEALLREGWEEAGLSRQQMLQAQTGSVMRLHRDVPEGLQLEDLYSHSLQLPAGLVPVNQDGEVAAFECLPIDQALGLAASQQMTVDASLVTLDFALRHQLCAAPAGFAGLLRPD